MNLPLDSDLKHWVEQEVGSGQYPSEEAMMVAALKALKGEGSHPALEDLIDLDFEEFCALEADDSTSLEDVLEATAKIPGSMAQAIIEDVGKHAMSRQLRTLDAIQLAVAIHLHRSFPLDYFVCSDQRLIDVARLEGLAVIQP